MGLFVFRLTNVSNNLLSYWCRRVFCVACFFMSVISLVFINSQNNSQESTFVSITIGNSTGYARFRDQAKVYQSTSRTEDLKYILFWKGSDYAPLYYFKEGRTSFIQQKCPTTNCFVTSDKKFFDGDLRKFDAIAFNGRRMFNNKKYLPQQRYAHQKFIYFNMESSDNYPVCRSDLDDFFNWTSTYKLDSDIPFPYIIIKNNLGEVVGPNNKMMWIENMNNVSEELSNKLLSKTKPLAWFVSHCNTRSRREKKMEAIQKALAAYNLTVDIYGSCGPLNCSRNKQKDCDNKLESDYYFYFSAENSFVEDYVTEKLLTALQHDLVPIVFGGADYSKFLPPGSYLDGKKLNSSELAAQIDHLMKTPEEYRQYFKWKSHYSYHSPVTKENICSLCAALNDKVLMEASSSYRTFREWWNPNFVKRCKLR